MEQLYLRKNQSRTTRVPRGPKVVMVDKPRLNFPKEKVAFALLGIMLAIFLIGLGTRYNEVNAADRATPVATVITAQAAPTVAPTVAPTTEILSRVFQPTVLRWETLIVETAWRYGFDPNLLAIVVQIESCGDPIAVSHAGAMGLGQVMPFHFAAGENPYDPATNLNRAAAYFAEGLKSSNNDIGLTFAGYNGGHGTVQKGRGYWKEETVRYFDAATAIFWDIKNGLTESPTIRDRYAPSKMCLNAATRG